MDIRRLHALAHEAREMHELNPSVKHITITTYMTDGGVSVSASTEDADGRYTTVSISGGGMSLLGTGVKPCAG